MLARRVVLSFALVFACDRDPPGNSREDARIALNGAGASFPYPLYSKWIAEYHRLYPNVRINYQSIGSGGGIRQIVAETVDFGATDSPVLETELRDARGKIVHVPMAIGSVVVSYNLAGVTRALRFTPGLLAGIYLGEIKRWNAPELAATNPDVVLPDVPIVVVFRTDGSGTTAAFSEALATASSTFKQQIGSGKQVSFPIGLGAKGNEGATGQLKSTPGSIGYIELAYATQNGLPRAEIQNRAGKFVGPAPHTAAAAANSVPMPDALHVSLSTAEGEDAYPLSTYTYFLVYEDSKHFDKASALARFLWWAIHDGQRYVTALDYARLPDDVVKKAEAKLLTLRAAGKPLLDGV